MKGFDVFENFLFLNDLFNFILYSKYVTQEDMENGVLGIN